jgi:hypothetical protein
MDAHNASKTKVQTKKIDEVCGYYKKIGDMKKCCWFNPKIPTIDCKNIVRQ